MRSRRALWLAVLTLVVAPVTPLAAGVTTQMSDAEAGKVFDRFLRTDWSGVYLLGQKMGWLKSSLSRSADGAAYVAETVMHAQIQMLGAEQEMEIQETRTYGGPGWRLRRIAFLYTLGKQETRITGEVKDDGFVLTHVMAGTTRPAALPRPKESLRDFFHAQLMALDPNTKPGTTIQCVQFDPMTGNEDDCVVTLKDREKLTLEGVETPITLVDVFIRQKGIRTISKVMPDGRFLETTLAAFTVRLESEAVAKRLDVALDTLAMSSIRLRHELPEVKRLSELVLTISGVKEDRQRIASERQAFDPTDTPGVYRLTLRRQTWKAEELAPGPYDREKFKTTLAASPFIQSDDKRLIDQAREIVGDATDPVERVRRLVNWVYRNIKKEYSAALSNALDVLQSRSGDCTEHTILLVALCRAAGIPAEEVAGVVYVNGYGAFLYHAWARAYVGKWIEVDPTSNEVGVHPGHIAFAVGPLEQQGAIVGLIGQVRLQFVSEKSE